MDNFILTLKAIQGMIQTTKCHLIKTYKGKYTIYKYSGSTTYIFFWLIIFPLYHCKTSMQGSFPKFSTDSRSNAPSPHQLTLFKCIGIFVQQRQHRIFNKEIKTNRYDMLYPLSSKVIPVYDKILVTA